MFTGDRCLSININTHEALTQGKGKGKRRGSEDLGSHNPPLNKTMIGAPTNFQVVGHLSVGDQEGTPVDASQ